MRLDVYIKYKEPKKRTIKAGLDGIACGSTMVIYPEDTEITEVRWSANITHNIGKMASHILVQYKKGNESYSNDLYSLVWRPEEYGCANTNILTQALQTGINYMMSHREELLQYNPSNGWGDYDSFLNWLIDYWRACINNPDCLIEASR